VSFANLVYKAQLKLRWIGGKGDFFFFLHLQLSLVGPELEAGTKIRKAVRY
jgi:hypothetical protein